MSNFNYGDDVVDVSGAEGRVVDETVGGGKVTVRITKEGPNSSFRKGQRVNILERQLRKK
ncbi:hypothetical protein SEA_ANNADREAMY_141 [Streptomyces phage Annadreamy]|uniref:Uncharacterized protein n=1 Tax=Streptomyces phage Annadreamy TaxID=2250335 RepID=A0A345GTG3_9CAUD|nr:hypothetical protein HWB75_gp128 [Streptomyces phage Annadreamy]AXG66235.1 hypothetical protein SEA_ANNADREAMY_141 [Streptomyces phage Annadreamy]